MQSCVNRMNGQGLSVISTIWIIISHYIVHIRKKVFNSFGRALQYLFFFDSSLPNQKRLMELIFGIRK